MDKKDKITPVCTNTLNALTKYNMLDINVCLVDNDGDILWVSDSWNEFHKNNSDIQLDFTKQNYFNVLQKSISDCDTTAETILNGIKDIAYKYKSTFIHHYPCHRPDKKQFYILVAEKYTYGENQSGVLIKHHDITEDYLKFLQQQHTESKSLICYLINDSMHHYRQQLNGIGLYLQDLADELEEKDMQNLIDTNITPSVELIKKLSTELDNTLSFYGNKDSSMVNPSFVIWKNLKQFNHKLVKHNIKIDYECVVFGNYDSVLSVDHGNITLRCGIGLNRCARNQHYSNILIFGDHDMFEWLIKHLFFYHFMNGINITDEQSESRVCVNISEQDETLTYRFSYTNMQFQDNINDFIRLLFENNFDGNIRFDTNAIEISFNQWKKKFPL
jgi:hypothetical protein